MALLFGNPVIEYTRKATHSLLQFSVVGLGFGMNALVALDAGTKGLAYTVSGIILTFTIGLVIARYIKLEKKTAYLIASGTAICGGSAIAAVAPVIDAKSEETSVALGVVFILNSLALIIFPLIGHALNLSQSQFGLWAAIAIHDTSSVVGAASSYGKEALAIATTVKLTRALWIIPVAFISGLVFKSNVKKYKIPYFIFAFFGAMIINTFFIGLQPAFHVIYLISKQGLVVTLFLIGSNITYATLKTVGIKPFIMGILLWCIISTISLIVFI
ncbi:MAG: putative sulfate exporter family transporter [Ignavibacteria bacterium]|nr:putative sulfate exporter family transporter [Ignavibacteria bacterium]